MFFSASNVYRPYTSGNKYAMMKQLVAYSLIIYSWYYMRIYTSKVYFILWSTMVLIYNCCLCLHGKKCLALARIEQEPFVSFCWKYHLNTIIAGTWKHLLFKFLIMVLEFSFTWKLTPPNHYACFSFVMMVFAINM